MDVSVGTRLRVLRKDAGLTQAQLAALAGTNQAAINRYETDRAAAPYRILVWYALHPVPHAQPRQGSGSALAACTGRPH